MRFRTPTGLRMLALLALGSVLLGPAAGAQEAPGAAAGSDVAASPPIYQLPKVGKPTGRVGGGRRGTGDGLPGLYAVVPDHVGYTTSRQPVLYWYLSDRVAGNVRLELTLIDEKSVDPLLDRQVPVHGIGRFRVVGAPAVRPDLARLLAGGAQSHDDADWLVVQH